MQLSIQGLPMGIVSFQNLPTAKKDDYSTLRIDDYSEFISIPTGKNGNIPGTSSLGIGTIDILATILIYQIRLPRIVRYELTDGRGTRYISQLRSSPCVLDTRIFFFLFGCP